MCVVLNNIGGRFTSTAPVQCQTVLGQKTRDHTLYKKYHPPYMSDEVWRLEKISKDGAFHKRLNKEKVKTVQEFLVLYFLDPTSLRNILGPGMSNKMWEVVVEHATKCVLDDNKLYLYCPQSNKKDGVVLMLWDKSLDFLRIASMLFPTTSLNQKRPKHGNW